MEFVIQKAIEIGVNQIVPISTSRCVVKIESPKKIQSKIDRWNKIAESAAKQSGRGIVPQVTLPMTFDEAVEYARAQNTKAIIPYENEKKIGIRKVLEVAHTYKYGIFIGPEGGFTEEEIHHAVSSGIQAVTLGNRILRSETASIVALTNIMYEMGEMG